MVAPGASAKFRELVGFVEADIRREIWLAEEERRTGTKITPYGGAGNLLLALGLLCYTEAFGAYLSGFRGRGWSAINFHWGFRKLGADYRRLMDEGERLDVYDHYRCGFVHEGAAKQPSLTAISFHPEAAHLCAVGRDADDGRLYFVVEKYFADLQRFISRLAEDPVLQTPVAADRLPSISERDAARYSDDATGLTKP